MNDYFSPRTSSTASSEVKEEEPPQRRRVLRVKQRLPPLPLALRRVQHPSRLLVTGRSKCGKTSVAVYTILQLHKRYKWHHIYLVCPTAEQPTFDPIRKYIERTWKEGDEETFTTILRRVKINHAEGRRSLLIIDDCSGDTGTNTGRKGALPTLANNARWLSLSIVIITQNMTSITPSFRDNADCCLMFNTLKQAERNYYLQERNPFDTPQMMKRVMMEAFEKGPHGFLTQVVDNQGVHFFSGLDQELITTQPRALPTPRR